MSKAQRMMTSFQAERNDAVELVSYHRFQVVEANVKLAFLTVAMFLYRNLAVPVADHVKEIGSLACAIAMAYLVWGMIFGL